MQVKEVAPVIADYWERAEFPHELVPKCAPLNLGGGTLAGNGCPGLTVTEFAMVTSFQHPCSATIVTRLIGYYSCSLSRVHSTLYCFKCTAGEC